MLSAVSGGVLAAALLAGCGNGTTGTPVGESSPTATNPAIPKVAAPLDETPFLDNPCKLIDPDVINSIGDFEPGEPDIDSELATRLTGPTCNWRWPQTTAGISLAIQTVHREYSEGDFKGIGSIYSKDQSEFEPVEIPGHPGYPAAFAGSSSADCPIYVGIADDLSIVVGASGMGGMCDASVKLAAAMLDTLKKGAG